jgi:hypothetical protein
MANGADGIFQWCVFNSDGIFQWCVFNLKSQTDRLSA